MRVGSTRRIPFSKRLTMWGSTYRGSPTDTLEQSRRQLTDAHLDRIMQQHSAVAVLPDGAVVPLTGTQPETRPDIVLVHGSPENTTHWRIREDHDAIEAFAELRGRAETFQPPGLPRLIFAGHTHQARAWQVALGAWTARERPLRPGEPLALATAIGRSPLAASVSPATAIPPAGELRHSRYRCLHLHPPSRRLRHGMRTVKNGTENLMGAGVIERRRMPMRPAASTPPRKRCRMGCIATCCGSSRQGSCFLLSVWYSGIGPRMPAQGVEH